jgi:hypothetical protein
VVGRGILVSQNFQMGSKIGTMFCTWHFPWHNGFHDLDNGACEFCIIGMWTFNNGEVGRPLKNCICAFLIKGLMKTV